jgi:hypothetical protein
LLTSRHAITWPEGALRYENFGILLPPMSWRGVWQLELEWWLIV